MITRIIVAVIATLLLFAALFFSEWTFYILLVGACYLAFWEIYNAFNRAGYNPLKWTGYVFALLFIPAGYFTNIDGMIVVLAMLGFACMANRVFDSNCKLNDVLSSIFSLFYVGIPFTFFMLTSRLGPLGVGYVAILTTLACPLMSDSFALFTGLAIGKRKLAPEISPNKTVEGSVGGVVGSVTAGVLLYFFVQGIWDVNYRLEHFLILSVLCNITGQLGDLVGSAIKRLAGIKDFGNIFPGHGGMLDRIDSIIFTVPIVYLYFKYIIIL